MTAQEIALDAAFALLPLTVLEYCFILFHSSGIIKILGASYNLYPKQHSQLAHILPIWSDWLSCLAGKPQKSTWIKTIH
jgi:hypothetical protein